MRLFYNSCPALIGDWLYFSPLISEGERKHEREKKLEPKFLSFKTPWSEEIGPGGPFQRIKKKMNQLSTKRLQLEGNAKKVSRNQKKQSRRLAHKHHTNTLVVSLSLSFSLATDAACLDAVRSPTGDGRWQPAPLNVARLAAALVGAKATAKAATAACVRPPV